MKIRIRGNSVRLRLLQSEVTQLWENKSVSDTIQFGFSNDEILTYTLRISLYTNKILADFINNEICIILPEELAKNWIETDRISLESEKTLANDSLKILIEKDFACITREDDPDNLDAFPNPDIDC